MILNSSLAETFLPSEASLQSKKEFFAGPKNTEANLSFIERAQLQTQVFCSLQNEAAASYFEQQNHNKRRTDWGRFEAAETILLLTCFRESIERYGSLPQWPTESSEAATHKA